MRRRHGGAERTSRLLSRAAIGLAAGAITLSAQGCNGPPLEPWHTEKLVAEFTAAMADEVRTFDDYRKLEDELFTQLDEEVYARTPTGPDQALVRYSAGSAADPRARQPDWNRSFELPAEAPVGGVLLLHGMSDSPYSLRAFGEALNRHGYRVLGLRLPGHGTAPSGLTRVRWEDMAAAVRLCMEHLESRLGGKPIHIAGYSTGAPLALHFALDALEGRSSPVPTSLVLISPAIGVSPTAALAGWKRRLGLLPGMKRLAWLQILPEFDPFKYNSFATNAGEQVHRLTRSVARRISARARTNPDEVLPPTLVFKSTVDATVSTDAVVDSLLELLAPQLHRHPGHQREPEEQRGRHPPQGTVLGPGVAGRAAGSRLAEWRDLPLPRGPALPARRPPVRPASSRRRGRALPRAHGHPGRAGPAQAPGQLPAATAAQSLLRPARDGGDRVDERRESSRRAAVKRDARVTAGQASLD
jgi:alpha-beta hydrolase superfamily lysophospholipase